MNWFRKLFDDIYENDQHLNTHKKLLRKIELHKKNKWANYNRSVKKTSLKK